MRSSITSLILLAITLPAQAQDKTKPNTLTPKEIADGWILLFDGETTFGWFSLAAKDLKAANGVLEMTGSLATTPFQFFELTFEYQASSKQFGLDLLRHEEKNRKAPEKWFSLARHDGWRAASLRVEQGKATLTAQDKQESIEWAGLTQIFFTGTAKFRNIKLRPLDTKPIFNGKDLTGWKTFPGDKYKSIFTVTDQGELNVKNGPGDLQTVGKYQDFVLQLECISHGKHLNSGIFFRCRDNEYQNGYEAQIRNQFTPEATQDYFIETYDPTTNKLLEKKKIQSSAVDYGTGAIYRRQPARKEMAKDGEWFAMTIVAQGNHLATWVNGVQVTDWYDHRPRSGNARTGCKLDAGHISIQGHDPTTNLSFRNLRIAAWPK